MFVKAQDKSLVNVSSMDIVYIHEKASGSRVKCEKGSDAYYLFEGSEIECEEKMKCIEDGLLAGAKLVLM